MELIKLTSKQTIMRSRAVYKYPGRSVLRTSKEMMLKFLQKEWADQVLPQQVNTPTHLGHFDQSRRFNSQLLAVYTHVVTHSHPILWIQHARTGNYRRPFFSHSYRQKRVNMSLLKPVMYLRSLAYLLSPAHIPSLMLESRAPTEDHLSVSNTWTGEENCLACY